jgi:hypothetical protein
LIRVPRAVPDCVGGLLNVAVLGHLRVDAVHVGACKPRTVRTQPLEGVRSRLAVGVDQDILWGSKVTRVGQGCGHDGEGHHGMLHGVGLVSGRRRDAFQATCLTKRPGLEREAGSSTSYDLRVSHRHVLHSYRIYIRQHAVSIIDSRVQSPPKRYRPCQSGCYRSRVCLDSPAWIYNATCDQTFPWFVPDQRSIFVIENRLDARGRSGD